MVATVSDSYDILLIGGGIASASAAAELRERGFEGSILLATRELDPPYHRPPITKGYLQGREDRDSTLIHSVAVVRRPRRRGAHARGRHGHRPRGAHGEDRPRGRRLRAGARRDRVRRAAAAGRRRLSRRHPLPARAAERRQAARRGRGRAAGRRRRRLVHRDRGRGVADDGRQVLHDRHAGEAADGAPLRPRRRAVRRTTC